MQLAEGPAGYGVLGPFQSSPVPEDGCNRGEVVSLAGAAGFNPHPSRRTGATTISGSGNKTRTLFQSSPVPEDGCNSQGTGHFRAWALRFQSSPVPEDGCNTKNAFGISSHSVSILTRPGGRVQREW